MAAPTTAASVKKTLANPEPSTHGPSRRLLRRGNAQPSRQLSGPMQTAWDHHHRSGSIARSTARPRSASVSTPAASRSIRPLTNIVVTISPGIAGCFPPPSYRIAPWPAFVIRSLVIATKCPPARTRSAMRLTRPALISSANIAASNPCPRSTASAQPRVEAGGERCGQGRRNSWRRNQNGAAAIKSTSAVHADGPHHRVLARSVLSDSRGRAIPRRTREQRGRAGRHHPLPHPPRRPPRNRRHVARLVRNVSKGGVAKRGPLACPCPQAAN